MLASVNSWDYEPAQQGWGIKGQRSKADIIIDVVKIIQAVI